MKLFRRMQVSGNSAEQLPTSNAARRRQLLQELHLSAPGPEKSPRAQGVQVLAPAALNVPDGHSWHVDCPVLALAYEPAPHMMQAVAEMPEE